MLFSCSGKKKPAELDLETLITQQSDTLTMIYTKNGKKDYRFSTPLMERYELAREPFMEFRYGINIITFESLGGEASHLVADYAIYYENRELWEARGNVRGTGEDGRKLYTQQLFWDEKTDKVYSNVDCKVVDGNDVFVGEGFESDSEFKDWVFRESEGRMWVDMSQSDEPEGDATAQEGAAEEPEGPQEVGREREELSQPNDTRVRPEAERNRPEVDNIGTAGRRKGDVEEPQMPRRQMPPRRNNAELTFDKNAEGGSPRFEVQKGAEGKLRGERRELKKSE